MATVTTIDDGQVGWHVMLDSTVWCLTCAPDAAGARAAAGGMSARVRVAPVAASWARRNDADCTRCDRPLAAPGRRAARARRR